jgi:hypothetical protein
MVNLGDKVKDNITGFWGIVTARCEYLYGCVRVQVTSKKLDEKNKEIELWFDEQRLDKTSKAKTGGPQKAPPKRGVGI